MEPVRLALDGPELGPELRAVGMASSLGSSLSDFKTRSPWAEAQRFRDGSSTGGWSCGMGPLMLVFREALGADGGETRRGSGREGIVSMDDEEVDL
jgi:hypothetical protein